MTGRTGATGRAIEEAAEALKPSPTFAWAGMAVRRVPPADGGDGPWQIMVPATDVRGRRRES
jgi:hypothetical protein